MKKIYQPRLEVTNAKETTNAWQDWGQFSRKSEAVQEAKIIMREINAGKYDSYISNIEKENGFALNACVEVIDADSFDLLYIEEVA